MLFNFIFGSCLFWEVEQFQNSLGEASTHLSFVLSLF